jgi:hypothetical protein
MVQARLLAKSKKMRLDRAKEDRKEEEFQNYQANGPLADLWAEFVMNGSPSALASYLAQGGDVDGQIRGALITLLQEMRTGNSGGAKPWRDFKTVSAVERTLFEDRWARRFSDQAQSKPISQRQAIQAHADVIGQELRAVEKRFDRGKLVFSTVAKKSRDTRS